VTARKLTAPAGLTAGYTAETGAGRERCDEAQDRLGLRYTAPPIAQLNQSLLSFPVYSLLAMGACIERVHSRLRSQICDLREAPARPRTQVARIAPRQPSRAASHNAR